MIRLTVYGRARLRHIGGTRWGTRRYQDMDFLKELKKEEVAA